MALLITTDLSCDRCDDWTGSAVYLRVTAGAEVRKLARQRGWKRIPGHWVYESTGAVWKPGEDLCPKCAAADEPQEDNRG